MVAQESMVAAMFEQKYNTGDVVIRQVPILETIQYNTILTNTVQYCSIIDVVLYSNCVALDARSHVMCDVI